MRQSRARGFAALPVLAFSALLLAACGYGDGRPGDNLEDQWSVAPEWTMYQGNAAHTGYVPVTLDTAKFGFRYAVDLPEWPPNPPACATGRVFITNRNYAGSMWLHALDGPTGGLVWSHDFGEIDSVHPPAYGDGTIYLTTGGHADSYLYAFDAAAGALRFQTPYVSQWSRYYAPVVYGGDVYAPGGEGSGVYAYDGTSGAVLWFAEVNQYDEWTPAVDETHVYAYTGEYDPKLSAFDRRTGTVAFEIPDPGFVWDGWSMNEAAVLGSRADVLAVNGGRLISFDLARRSIGWQVAGEFSGQVSVAQGTVYAVNGGRVEARSEADGRLLWSWAPPARNPELRLEEPMIVTKSHVLVSCETFDITGFNPSGVTCAVGLASHETEWSLEYAGFLALSKSGRLFIATRGGQLVAVDVK